MANHQRKNKISVRAETADGAFGMTILFLQRIEFDVKIVKWVYVNAKQDDMVANLKERETLINQKCVNLELQLRVNFGCYGDCSVRHLIEHFDIIYFCPLSL